MSYFAPQDVKIKEQIATHEASSHYRTPNSRPFFENVRITVRISMKCFSTFYVLRLELNTNIIAYCFYLKWLFITCKMMHNLNWRSRVSGFAISCPVILSLRRTGVGYCYQVHSQSLQKHNLNLMHQPLSYMRTFSRKNKCGSYISNRSGDLGLSMFSKMTGATTSTSGNVKNGNFILHAKCPLNILNQSGDIGFNKISRWRPPPCWI